MCAICGYYHHRRIWTQYSLESECVTEFCAAIVSPTFLAPHPPSPVSFPPLPLRLCRSPAARPRELPPFQLLHRSNGIQSALCLLWVVQPMARDGHQTWCQLRRHLRLSLRPSYRTASRQTTKRFVGSHPWIRFVCHGSFFCEGERNSP